MWLCLVVGDRQPGQFCADKKRSGECPLQRPMRLVARALRLGVYHRPSWPNNVRSPTFGRHMLSGQAVLVRWRTHDGPTGYGPTTLSVSGAVAGAGSAASPLVVRVLKTTPGPV